MRNVGPEEAEEEDEDNDDPVPELRFLVEVRSIHGAFAHHDEIGAGWCCCRGGGSGCLYVYMRLCCYRQS